VHIQAETIDDLLREVFDRILKEGDRVVPTKGPNRELFGVVLELTKPLARVSRTEMKGRLYSALGELFWYLAGSDDLAFIQYYLGKKSYESDDGKAVWGAYGPRLFRMRDSVNQITQVKKLLSDEKRSSSRKAVIQLFNAEDISHDHKDVPCTCTLQFLVRKTGLDMFVSMRSNDAYKGLPHDVFAFTMLQEILACDLRLPLGRYKHAAGSLHLYEADEADASEFIGEAWQDVIEMPSMPKGDPWKSVDILKLAEEEIRNGKEMDVNSLGLEDYWSDLVRLLLVFALTKKRPAAENREKVDALAQAMSSDFFRPYISDRKRRIG
jgi:thymidylate synthase